MKILLQYPSIDLHDQFLVEQMQSSVLNEFESQIPMASVEVIYKPLILEEPMRTTTCTELLPIFPGEITTQAFSSCEPSEILIAIQHALQP